jgi:hypothetical protein
MGLSKFFVAKGDFAHHSRKRINVGVHVPPTSALSTIADLLSIRLGVQSLDHGYARNLLLLNDALYSNWPPVFVSVGSLCYGYVRTPMGNGMTPKHAAATWSPALTPLTLCFGPVLVSDIR